MANRVNAAPFGGKRGSTPEEIRLKEYIFSHSVRHLPVLRGLYEASLQHKRAGMLSPPDSIAILQLLLRLTSAKVVVEVGTFTGFTALGMALALPTGGKIYTLDITKEHAAMGIPHWQEAGVANKIEFIEGPAASTLPALLERLGPESVDVGFIDADKSGYNVYYEHLLQLVRPGGVIVIDNTLWGGRVIDDQDQSEDTQAIRALNAKVFRDPRVQIAMLTNSDGITVARRLGPDDNRL